MTGYVGDGETLPTTPMEALDILNGYIEDDEEREDINEAFAILYRLIDSLIKKEA